MRQRSVAAPAWALSAGLPGPLPVAPAAPLLLGMMAAFRSVAGLVPEAGRGTAGPPWASSIRLGDCGIDGTIGGHPIRCALGGCAVGVKTQNQWIACAPACSALLCRDIAKSDKQWKVVLLRYFNPVGAHPSGAWGLQRARNPTCRPHSCLATLSIPDARRSPDRCSAGPALCF